MVPVTLLTIILATKLLFATVTLREIKPFKVAEPIYLPILQIKSLLKIAHFLITQPLPMATMAEMAEEFGMETVR